MKVTVKFVRLAFGQGVFVPKEPDEGDGPAKFQCKGLIEPDDPQVKLFRAAEDKVAAEKWTPAKAPAIMKGLRAQDRTAIHDGNNKSNWEGFEGMLYINASSEKRPSVKDLDGVTNLVLSDGKIFSGVYVNLLIELWAQDNKFGKRINASLRGVQYVKIGDAFSGGGSAPADDEEFENLAVADRDDV